MPPTNQPLEGYAEQVDLSQVPVQTPAGCPHQFEEDPSDETEHFIAIVCLKCHWGYLKRKHIDAAS